MKPLSRIVAVDAALTGEINREKASGLGRTGRLLEEALVQCTGISQALSRTEPGERRNELLKAYVAARSEALRQRWNLEVQREAMGLRHHADLDRIFPLPPALSK
jgi:hypothetical protein